MSYYDVMKNAILSRLSTNDAESTMYQLKLNPDSELQSTILIFAMNRIIIIGDWCLGDKGVISDIGYGLSWFAGTRDPHYLASKFLRREWIPNVFREWVVEMIAEADNEERRDWEIGKGCIEHDMTEKEAWEFLLKYADRWELFEVPDRIANFPFRVKDTSDTWKSVGLYDALTDGIGYDYNPDDVHLLSDIQRRFAEEYRKA